MSTAVMEPEAKHFTKEDCSKKLDYLDQQVRRTSRHRPQTLQFAHEYGQRLQAMNAMLADDQSAVEKLDASIQSFGCWLSEQHPLLWRCANIPV